MGATHVTVQVKEVSGKGKGFEGEFLVDTGAIDCMAAASNLKKAGIKPEGKGIYERGDGSAIEMQYGFARLRFMGEQTVAQIIFGPEDSEPILGVVALENTGIVVDPRSRKLHRLHARPLKAAGGDRMP
ncbi:MAG TPA: clan AA aspartic protease [Phycisphaerae bacterium]|nr:clan AA aspartic protease [Phycisphaerae bacterium]